jgi:hypothetical protein
MLRSPPCQQRRVVVEARPLSSSAAAVITLKRLALGAVGSAT